MTLHKKFGFIKCRANVKSLGDAMVRPIDVSDKCQGLAKDSSKQETTTAQMTDYYSSLQKKVSHSLSLLKMRFY